MLGAMKDLNGSEAWFDAEEELQDGNMEKQEGRENMIQKMEQKGVQFKTMRYYTCFLKTSNDFLQSGLGNLCDFTRFGVAIFYVADYFVIIGFYFTGTDLENLHHSSLLCVTCLPRNATEVGYHICVNVTVLANRSL